jgi:hypothetical protein
VWGGQGPSKDCSATDDDDDHKAYERLMLIWRMANCGEVCEPLSIRFADGKDLDNLVVERLFR